MNPDIERILREQAELMGATGDMEFLGSVEPIKKPSAPGLQNPYPRSSGWTNPQATARDLQQLFTTPEGAERLHHMMQYAESWTAPLDGVSRAIGGALSGKNPLDTGNNPLLSEALTAKGVPRWLATTAEFFVPDPTGAKTIGDLIPVIGVLASPQGIRQLREFIERAFHMSNNLPPGTARRAYVASGLLTDIDDALEQGAVEGMRQSDLVELTSLREEVYRTVDWDRPLTTPISTREANTNMLDLDALTTNLNTLGDVELDPFRGHQLERLIQKWSNADDGLERGMRDIGRIDMLDDALNPGAMLHGDANRTLGEWVGDTRLADTFTPRGRALDLLEQFGAGSDDLLRAAGAKPLPRGAFRDAGIDVMMDAQAAKGQGLGLEPGGYDILLDPAVAAPMQAMLDVSGLDINAIAELVKTHGLDQVISVFGDAIFKIDPAWDAPTARMALRAITRNVEP